MKLRIRIIIAVLIVVMVAGSAFLLFREGTLPVDKKDKSTKIFVIGKGESLSDIANKLNKEKLIRNRVVFYLVIRQLGIEKNIQAGDFRLSPSFDTYQIAKNLTRGSLDTWVTIIEGHRKEEIAQTVSQTIGIPEPEFIAAAKEGYLFPDTYLIPKEASATAVINILTTNFNSKFTQAKEEVPKKNNLTDEEIITLASLIEREARFDEDRAVVADILLRRLDEDIALGVDATLQYILGYEPKEKRWWRSGIDEDTKEVDSPYNTYKYTGLPFGPISNPGILSIKAALGADGETPYLYYMHDKSGKIHVGRDLEEHQRNIDKYLE